MLFQDKLTSLTKTANNQQIDLIRFLGAFGNVCRSASALAEAENIRVTGKKRRRGGVLVGSRPDNASPLCALASSFLGQSA